MPINKSSKSTKGRTAKGGSRKFDGATPKLTREDAITLNAVFATAEKARGFNAEKVGPSYTKLRNRYARLAKRATI